MTPAPAREPTVRRRRVPAPGILEPNHLEAEVLHRLESRRVDLVDDRGHVVLAPDAAHSPGACRERLRVRRGKTAPRRFREPAILARLLVRRGDSDGTLSRSPGESSAERLRPRRPGRARASQPQEQRASVLVATIENLVVGLVVVRHQAAIAGRHARRPRLVREFRRRIAQSIVDGEMHDLQRRSCNTGEARLLTHEPREHAGPPSVAS